MSRVLILVDVDWRRKLDSTHLLAVASSGLNGPAFSDISQSIGSRTVSGKIGTVAAMLHQKSNAADRARVAPGVPECLVSAFSGRGYNIDPSFFRLSSPLAISDTPAGGGMSRAPASASSSCSALLTSQTEINGGRCTSATPPGAFRSANLALHPAMTSGRMPESREVDMTHSNLKVEVHGNHIVVVLRGTCFRAKYRKQDAPWLATDEYGPDDPEASDYLIRVPQPSLGGCQ